MLQTCTGQELLHAIMSSIQFSVVLCCMDLAHAFSRLLCQISHDLQLLLTLNFWCLNREKDVVSVKPEGFGPALAAEKPSRSDEMTACHTTNLDGPTERAQSAAQKQGEAPQ